MKSSILKYGVVGGLFASFLGTLNWLFIARPLGVGVSQSVGYLGITVSLLCIPLGIRYFRDQLNGGRMSANQSLKIGMGITTVAAMVMALHSVVFFALQKEEFLTWQREGLSEAELIAFNEQLAQQPDFVYTPLFQGVVMFVMVLLIGIVMNLISLMILKKEVEVSS